MVIFIFYFTMLAKLHRVTRAHNNNIVITQQKLLILRSLLNLPNNLIIK
jgi:hypothetical protein